MARAVTTLIMYAATQVVMGWALLACFTVLPMPPAWLAVPAACSGGAFAVSLADDLWNSTVK